MLVAPKLFRELNNSVPCQVDFRAPDASVVIVFPNLVIHVYFCLEL